MTSAAFVIDTYSSCVNAANIFMLRCWLQGGFNKNTVFTGS